MQLTNKRKIFNDPVHGFITIPNDIIFDVIEHPYFQRLRNIKQLGLTYFVYHGALHTRFSHALGAMHLMMESIEVLRQKGFEITEEESLGALLAILLHDIGHAPFSHSLEHLLVADMSHEDFSALLIQRMNIEFKGKLDVALQIFTKQYPKKYLCQLVSGQLDVDRLDYLSRDSFFTGVSEGVIGTERIIKMLSVVNDELVVDEKGIYSIEKFIIARRLMYWQVYLHKTVLSAEQIMIKILQRAKYLAENGVSLFGSPDLILFLQNNFHKQDFLERPELLDALTMLDDHDIHAAIKVWQSHSDHILSTLSRMMINRRLFKIEIQNAHFDETYIAQIKQKSQNMMGMTPKELEYFIFTEEVQNKAYNMTDERINILFKDGKIKSLVDASDQLDASFLSKIVTKHILCYPKELRRES